jgi:manganese/zinc/iron transport system permease protein
VSGIFQCLNFAGQLRSEDGSWLLGVSDGVWVRLSSLLLFQHYNTRVVVLGAMLLGVAAGMVGCFTLLRRRALVGDALSHATLPGVGLAFLLAPLAGLDGGSRLVLLAGAASSGIAGAVAILFIRSLPRLKEDAALGIVLSVFFGAGVALLTVVQQSPTGRAAGLDRYIFGQTASMTADDAWLIAATAALMALLIAGNFRSLTLLCFDEGYASAQGYSIPLLDLLLMFLVVLITMIGLQAVGLILMIAMLVIPAAAARFWTNRLLMMLLISGLIGGVSGFVGALLSAVFADLPSGAVIVLTCGLLFFLSLLLGGERGVLVRSLRRRELAAAIDREHLLRGIWELRESLAERSAGETDRRAASFDELLSLRSWSVGRLRSQIRRASAEGLVWLNSEGAVELTRRGVMEAERLVHHHRLWELYLITHADVAASRVDREADAIEHVLEPELIARLEQLLLQRQRSGGIPASPHQIAGVSTQAAGVSLQEGQQS